mgnify:CR=1 FL=1
MHRWVVALLLISPRLMACDCAEATVLWIDHANQRYYVSLDEATDLSIQAKVYDLVGEIQTEQPTWLGHVRIGFLAEGTSAEPHTPASTAYLADYDQATSTLTLDPASENPQRVEVFVSIPVQP